MPSSKLMIRKLQHALNSRGMKVMYCSSQFYSEDQDRPVNIYSIKQAVWSEERQKYVNVEMYKASSQIRIILFLRDLWYTIEGKELPKDIFNSQKGE